MRRRITMAKLRSPIVAGSAERVAPSHARATKPPAKEISKRKHAAMGSGGGRLPPAIRREFAREGTERRVKPLEGGRQPSGTRYGKRKPDAGRYAEAVEQHDRREQRKSNTPETEPGANAVPATRITRNEPKPGKHRKS
jgi:hypothetical protein